MWGLLKRQASTVWFQTPEREGHVVLDGHPKLGAVQDVISDVIAGACQQVRVKSVATVNVSGVTLVTANFDEGVVVVLPRLNSNLLAIRASVRRWPGAEMLGESEAAFGSGNATAVASSSDLARAVQASSFSTLEEESFGDENVLGEHSSPADFAAKTRVMECTWIQIVEHFGRIADRVTEGLGVADAVQSYERVSESLDPALSVRSGAFETSRPSVRIDAADAESIEVVYRAWVKLLDGIYGGSIAADLPAIDATPWRGLLKHRDPAMATATISI